MLSDVRLADKYPAPHFAVIFTSRRRETDDEGYGRAANRMIELAAKQDGFLGVESVRDNDRVGITVSYWRDLDSIQRWHDEAEHRDVQELGRSTWYSSFVVRVCRVERSYDFQNTKTCNTSVF